MKYKEALIYKIKTSTYGKEINAINPGKIAKNITALPNELIYFVDYRRNLIEILHGDSKEIIGYKALHATDLDVLYDHVDINHLDDFMYFTQNIVCNIVLKPKNSFLFEVKKDLASISYSSKNGKTLLKQTMMISRCANGIMDYSIGKITNITNLVDPKYVKYDIIGKNRELLLDKFFKINEKENGMTSREYDVLELIGKGYKSKQMANSLNLSIHTINTHKKNIIKKLGVSGSLQAYIKAKELEII